MALTRFSERDGVSSMQHEVSRDATPGEVSALEQPT